MDGRMGEVGWTGSRVSDRIGLLMERTTLVEINFYVWGWIGSGERS